MSLELIAGSIVGGIVLVVGGIIFAIKRPKRLKADRFIASWRELQGYCRDKATWPLAITEADKLLDAALKKRKLKGKTMGERLVSAQRMLTDNDDTWFAHNLAKKIAAQADANLKESDVKDALLGFRQALRDIGALPAGKEVSDDK
jgi:hypothetical protein